MWVTDAKIALWALYILLGLGGLYLWGPEQRGIRFGETEIGPEGEIWKQKKGDNFIYYFISHLSIPTHGRPRQLT